MKNYYVYIMANKKNGTLYTGVTNDLVRRVGEHKSGLGAEFTRRYEIERLVWYEQCTDVEAAIAAEKRFKRWRRAWKIDLIEQSNPDWRDLYGDLLG